MAATERGVFLEQALVQIESEMLGFGVGIGGIAVARRIAIHHAIAEQHIVKRLATEHGIGGKYLGWPHFIRGEALGEFNDLPDVGTCLAGRIDQLMPELRAPLGVAVSAFLLHPHRRRQHQVS